MARRVTIDQYNRMVRQHNQNVKRDIDRYNQDVKRQNDANNREIRKVNAENKRLADKYNRQVRNFNSKQRQKRAEYERVLRQMNTTPIDTGVVYNTTEIIRSSQALNSSYEMLGRDLSSTVHSQDTKGLMSYWPERETTNSVELCNALNGNYVRDISTDFLQKSDIEVSLSSLSTDLGKRWKGALFSLNHNNPDASRHFCTSVREILTTVIEIKAPDIEVSNSINKCEYHNGKPNRRSKITYLILNNALPLKSLGGFVDNDVKDILNLFEKLNSGTHGNAGKMTVQQLIQLKKRVEDSIHFILEF